MKKLTAIAAALALALTLAGCVGVDRVSSPVDNPKDGPAPSFAAEPEITETPEPEPEPDDMIVSFGDAMTWVDEVSLSVSAPTGFVPTEYAAGADQAHHVVFKLVLTNNSTAVLEPSVYSRVSSGGVEASSIFDSGNPAGDVGFGPTTAILPGQTVEWLEAYSIADPANITFQVAPSFDYEDAIFTNIGG